MSVASSYQIIKNNLLDLLFPVVCLGCGDEGRYLCHACETKLKKNEVQLCAVCGSLSPFGLTHPNCKTEFSLDGLISAVAYKEPQVRKLVEFCKYKFISDITEVMAGLMAKEVQNLELVDYFKDFILIPLPLHQSRKRWRGFNQAELIASHFAIKLNFPQNNEILIRKKKTKVQAELKDDERKTNVQEAFQTTVNVQNQKFIIIDDVSTTRSTLSEACTALKKSGATEVWGITFAQG
jgi:competence protein ComFC